MTEFNYHILDDYDCDKLLHQKWSDFLLRREKNLKSKCWFDHRPYHTVINTYHYAELFTAETRRIIRTHIDNRPPKIDEKGNVFDWFPVKKDDIFDPPNTQNEKRLKFYQRKINGLIRARQFADNHGIPYEVAVKAALKHYYFGRYYFTEYKKLPDPTMLNGRECQENILDTWIQSIESRIQCAKHKSFLLSSDTLSEHANEHQKWLLDQIARKVNPVFALSKFIKAGYLSEEKATERFGIAKVNLALQR